MPATPIGLVRSFLAVEIPDDVKDQVCHLIGQLQRLPLPVRYVGRNNLHLTLVFLGENSPEFTARAVEVLRPTLTTLPAFTWSLNGLGAFPNPRAARVVWLGVGHGAEPLRALAEAANRALATIEFMPESRPFSPHLTIGRIRNSRADVQTVITREFTSRSFPADRVVHFRSFLQPGGPVYHPLAEYTLAAPSA